MQLLSPSEIRDLLKKHSGSVKKSLGQNFLTDPNQVRKMADAVTDAALKCGRLPVLEIGPGTGALTGALADRLKLQSNAAGYICECVETDPVMVRILHERFADDIEKGRLKIIQADAKKFLKHEEGKEYAVIAGNLPYYITTDLILLSVAVAAVQQCFFLVQKEYAQRLTARDSRSSLTVYMANLSECEELFRVPAGCFYPAPSVESSFVRMQKKPEPHCNPEILEMILRMSFHARRKKLANTWINYIKSSQKSRVKPGLKPVADEERLLEAAKICGLDTQKRAEQCSHEEFFKLANAYKAFG